jgi:hypothetical protein
MSSINSVVTLWKISGIDLIPNEALRKRYLQYGVLKQVSLLLSSSNFKCQNPEVASTFLMRPPLLKLKTNTGIGEGNIPEIWMGRGIN